MRVVAVSAESSLAAALNMMDGWEVVFAREGDDIFGVVAGAAVVLAGGGTQHGLEFVSNLRARGVDTPAVVLGDSPPPDDAESTVLSPPFTLDELRVAVEGAVRTGRVAKTQTPPPAIEPQQPVAAWEPDAEPASVEDARTPALPAEIEVPVAPAPPARVGGNGSLGHAPDVREVPPSTVAAVEAGPLPTAQEFPPPVAAVSPPSAPPAERSSRRKRRRDREEAAQGFSPARASESTGSVDARLRLAEQAVAAIEDAIREMPFLADLEALSEAIVGEVVEAFSPEIVALYLLAGDGFWVGGGHKLTPAERRLNVKPEHPLFRELLANREPILIAPLDLARAMVSGIAGARTEAMIAGPIQSADGCVGVIIVGRDDFADKDLDTLAHLAEEAASGLAVGLGVDRLRSRRL